MGFLRPYMYLYLGLTTFTIRNIFTRAKHFFPFGCFLDLNLVDNYLFSRSSHVHNYDSQKRPQIGEISF